MKKFSINSLKVVLLLIIGLCVLSITSSVEAAPKVIRTYYAYNGGTLTIQREENDTITTTIFDKNTNVDANNSITRKYDINWHKGTSYNITLPNDLTIDKSYYIINSVAVSRRDY